MTIDEFIQNYPKTVRYRGHTPGHKGRLNPSDITELGDEFPAGLVQAAEAAAARVYGARALWFLTNGSSIGIKAAVLALGKDFVTEGYCHCAVTEAASLARVNCFKLPVDIEEDTGLPALPTADTLLKEMRNWQVKTAVLQYPDYYGRCCDLKAIYAAFKERRFTLICDSAHGAHFAFAPDLFPLSAVRASDICNMSAHKTLAAYTQTAYLASSGDIADSRIDECLKNLGTTSPNYLLLASLESAALRAQASGEEYRRLKRFSDHARSLLPCLENDDFSRLVVDFGKGGRAAAAELVRLGIYPEKADERYVLFILTPCDTDEQLKVLLDGLVKTYTKQGKNA